MLLKIGLKVRALLAGISKKFTNYYFPADFYVWPAA
jgi:hypothetical protein